jgi:hypothetical protein
MAEELPVVLLFDAEQPGFSYGDRFDAAFLRALKTIDIKRTTRSRVMRGDLLIHQLAYKPAKVSMIPGAPSARAGLRSRSSSIEMRGDKDFFATLVGDLCDALPVNGIRSILSSYLN